MYKKLFVFTAALLVLMLWWRASLFDQPHISPTDLDHMGVRGSVGGVLPPSGFQPGHLLRDTLKNEKLHTPPYMDLGRYAYRQYLTADSALRARVRAELEHHLQPAEDWIAATSERGLDFLCIGESHQENYRHFLAEHFFPRYALDILFLEARLLPTKMMHVRADVGEEEVELLSADIAAIIRAAKRRNPALAIVGIEESNAQRAERRGLRTGSRDQSLFTNVTGHYRAGSRSAALLGALHCTQRANWLYARLERERSAGGIDAIANMRLMSERKDLLSREFSRFLTLLGLPERDYAVIETDSIDEVIHRWFLGLTRRLEQYQAVILFRDADEDEPA